MTDSAPQAAAETLVREDLSVSELKLLNRDLLQRQTGILSQLESLQVVVLIWALLPHLGGDNYLSFDAGRRT